MFNIPLHCFQWMLYPLPMPPEKLLFKKICSNNVNIWPVFFLWNISTTKLGPNDQVKLEIWPLLMVLDSGESHAGSFIHHEMPFPKLFDLNYPKFVDLGTWHFKKKILFVHLFLAMLSLCGCTGFSLGAVSGVHSPLQCSDSHWSGSFGGFSCCVVWALWWGLQ